MYCASQPLVKGSNNIYIRRKKSEVKVPTFGFVLDWFMLSAIKNMVSLHCSSTFSVINV